MPAGEEALPDDDDAVWRRPWADLPLDLLRDMSHRLHATTDYVRFHATCKPWRDTLPPPPCYPAFLPWLVAPPDSTKHRKARCVFSSSSKSTRSGTSATTGILVRDRRWVISMVDGTAVSTLTTGSSSGSDPSGDPLTGSASATPLPPFSCDDETEWWVNHADGTIFLYLFGADNRSCYYLPEFNAALLRPGDAACTKVHKQSYLGVPSIAIGKRPLQLHCPSRWKDRRSTRQILVFVLHRYDKALQSSYLLESQGELLLANVLAIRAGSNTLASFVDGLSVSVHALREAEGGKTEWVERESRSLIDRVMFLGRPSSFSVDAARFGTTNGGCAYFIIKNELYGGIWSKSATKRCRVFMYSFRDNRSELIEQLPAEWDDGLWLTPPQPSIASTEEIRERIHPTYCKRATIRALFQNLRLKSSTECG